jgi:hypothetical protein
MGMEDETRDFLILIANTISWVLLWMMANVFFGIYLGFGFFENRPGLYNILYYIGGLSSLIFVIRGMKRKWKL